LSDATLEQFFSRPIKIRTYDWGTGLSFFQTFNPWQDFWENPRVINRITNFNLLRCKMHVRILINGNGFHYGRAIASYLPLHVDDAYTRDRALILQDTVASSQRPHIYLDPTKSQGGVISLPFVWPLNALDIPGQDWRNMGTMSIRSINSLKHANGATDSVTVSVFAWATDVTMSILTANEPGALSPQAGSLDEYNGVISRPASVLARVAGALESIPSISPFALATRLAANTVATIAQTFGYSRPINIVPIQPLKPEFFGNLANTVYPDHSTKLTFDPKQELTVDTRTFGLAGKDEMSIRSVASVESYLTTFPWNVTSPVEGRLFNIEVNPVVWNRLASAPVEYHMPACCYAALPFRAWRGTMRYRFQIVASSFHKGRLKITYDPSFPLTNEYNTNYTHIVDIANERDFTIEVGWGQQYPYLSHRNMITNAGNIWSTSALGGDPGELANGIISVYVVNELTIPNSIANNDIDINVFVSCHDLEVADPTDAFTQELTWLQPQSGLLEPQSGKLGDSPDGDLTQEESIPSSTSVAATMSAPISSTDMSQYVFYGDPVVSIRQILKRYNQSITHVPPSGVTTERMCFWDMSIFPLVRGYQGAGIHLTNVPVASTPYNFARMTMLNYFSPAYVCWRGGIRWKFHAVGSSATTNLTTLAVLRNPSATTGYTAGSTALSLGATSASIRAANAVTLQPSSLCEAAYFNNATLNPVAEVELPYYIPRRFSSGKQANWSSVQPGLMMKLLARISFSSTNHCFGIDAFCATGEDFTLGFYTGPPVAFRQVNPAAA